MKSRFCDPLSSNLRTEGNFQARFSRRKSIEFNKFYRLTSCFLRYVNSSIRIFGDSVSCPGLYGGLYGQNLPYKFKKSYGDFQHRNFEKSHRTTGPPDRSGAGFVILSKFWSRYDLQNFRKRIFLGDDQGELSKGTVLRTRVSQLYFDLINNCRGRRGSCSC